LWQACSTIPFHTYRIIPMASNHNIIAGTCGITAMVLSTSELALVSNSICSFKRRYAASAAREEL
jgi:hypothetical protein